MLMRNLVNIDDNRHVVFLYPEKNNSIKQNAKKAKDFLEPAYADHLHLITLDKAIKVPPKNMLYDYYHSDFYEKYLDF